MTGTRRERVTLMVIALAVMLAATGSTYIRRLSPGEQAVITRAYGLAHQWGIDGAVITTEVIDVHYAARTSGSRPYTITIGYPQTDGTLDRPAEFAFMLAHELGHVAQFREGWFGDVPPGAAVAFQGAPQMFDAPAYELLADAMAVCLTGHPRPPGLGYLREPPTQAQRAVAGSVWAAAGVHTECNEGGKP